MTKSYLKWVGGKRQLSKELIKKFPHEFNRYIEPFCGSCAMFFSYYGQEETDIFNTIPKPPAILNDSNHLLINAHKSIQQDFKSVSIHLDNLKNRWDNYDDKYKAYLTIREELNKSIHDDSFDIFLKSALFIFINKTCFNGIWRVNSKGLFNVPWNKKEKISLYKSSNLRQCSELLKQYSKLECIDFYDFLEKESQIGDFVFLDPPYIPTSRTSSFTSYTCDGWSNKDDKRLSKILDIMDKRGVKFMMTNSESPLVYALFGKWNIEEVRAHRFVKALNKNEKRKMINETVVTNFKNINLNPK